MESDINNEIPKSTFMYSLMYTWPNKAYRLYFVNWSIKRLEKNKNLTSKPDPILTKLFFQFLSEFSFTGSCEIIQVKLYCNTKSSCLQNTCSSSVWRVLYSCHNGWSTWLCDKV